MAHNPHGPQGPDPYQDPAGNTQMFQAFLDQVGGDDGGRGRRSQQSGPRIALIIGVLAVVTVFGAAVWLALI